MKFRIGKKKELKKVCSKCGKKECTFVKKYQKWYCPECKIYIKEEKEETKVLKPTTQHLDATPPPPPVEEEENKEETKAGESKLEEVDQPQQEEANQEAAIKQQKDADMEYYNKLYSEVTLTSKDNTKLLYGVLSEAKTLNFQLAQLIEMIRQGLLIKK